MMMNHQTAKMTKVLYFLMIKKILQIITVILLIQSKIATMIYSILFHIYHKEKIIQILIEQLM